MITQENKELLNDLLEQVQKDIDDYDFDYENKMRREALASQEFQDHPECFDMELLTEVENKPEYLLKWTIIQDTDLMTIYDKYIFLVLDSEGEYVCEKEISRNVATLLNTKDFVLSVDTDDYGNIIYFLDTEKLTLLLK